MGVGAGRQRERGCLGCDNALPHKAAACQGVALTERLVVRLCHSAPAQATCLHNTVGPTSVLPLPLHVADDIEWCCQIVKCLQPVDIRV